MCKYLNNFLFLFFVITINICQAQLEAYKIADEGWARGNLVEIGINSKGVYGAKTANKPASFHDNREDANNLFGFIANPQNDGWIDYDGDFFTPGIPEEGFSVEINGINYSNNNEDSGIFQIPGEVTHTKIITSECFENISQIIWEGNINGINIKRYYTITENGLYIQMITIIKNLSSETKNNVYFMHNVDPDNNVTLSNIYETNMEIISQASSLSDKTSLVIASQEPLFIPEDMDGSNVSFYANSDKARVSIGGFNNRSASSVWMGIGTIIEEGATETFFDRAISIAFNLGDITPHQSVRFTYYYVLEKIDEFFTPNLVNILPESINTCNGTDGKLVFTGLKSDITYSISYMYDGVASTEKDYVANNEGTIEISNLTAGKYTNLSLTFNGCSTILNTTFVLEDPKPPFYKVNKTDYSTCVSELGVLTFSGLNPSTDYEIQFDFSENPISPKYLTSNIFGVIEYTNLSKGLYSNFIVENKQTKCITSNNDEIEIFEIEDLLPPISYQIPDQFYCDEDNDYITTVDLSLLNTFVLGPDSASEYEITYHITIDDVETATSVTTLDYETTGEPIYTLFAKKTDINTGCYSYLPFSITINLPAVFNIDDELICLNNDDSVNFDYQLPNLNTGLSNTTHSFVWFFENGIIQGETSSMLIANKPGNYSVEATIIETECKFTEQFSILPSGPPKELEVIIISSPFSENHTAEITANGYGNYIFSVDNGVSQQSNTFEDLKPGYHNFQIIDANGCGVINIEKTIIDYMKFFTPNNDGFNDFWQIVGIEGLIEPRIFIFDRFGKLLKQLDSRSNGWDGSFNGTLLPQSDYWFKIIFKDKNNIRREFLEHFTLKR